MTKSQLDLTWTQILAFPRRVGAVDQRLPGGYSTSGPATPLAWLIAA